LATLHGVKLHVLISLLHTAAACLFPLLVMQSTVYQLMTKITNILNIKTRSGVSTYISQKLKKNASVVGGKLPKRGANICLQEFTFSQLCFWR